MSTPHPLDYHNPRTITPTTESAEAPLQTASIVSSFFVLIPVLGGMVGSGAAFGLGLLLNVIGSFIGLSAIVAGPNPARVAGAVSLAVNGGIVGLVIWAIFVHGIC